MNKQIPIIVINLKKSLAKKKRMTAMLDSLGLEFSFLEAVYGQELTTDELNRAYIPENSLTKRLRALTKPEIGCALSHMKIYQYILDNNIDKVIILEDDVIIDNDFIDALSFVKYLPKDWELLLLGHSATSTDQSKNCRVNIALTNNPTKFLLGKPVATASGTYGYIINQHGATKLLQQTQTLYKAMDDYTGHYKIINLYDIYPQVVTVDFSFGSDTSKEVMRLKAEKKHNQHKLLTKISDFNRARKLKRKWSINCFVKKLRYKINRYFSSAKFPEKTP